MKNSTLSFVLFIFTAIGCKGDRSTQMQEVVSQPAQQEEQADVNEAWPPAVGERFVPLNLTKSDGSPFSLSSLEGQVILVEPIGMPCGASQALAGAHEVGRFREGPVQSDVPTVEALVEGYGFDLAEVQYVQLLLYNMAADGPPSREEAAAWEDHFSGAMDSEPIVVFGDQSLISPASYATIPGLFVVDSSFVLRADLQNDGVQQFFDSFRDVVDEQAGEIRRLRRERRRERPIEYETELRQAGDEVDEHDSEQLLPVDF